MKSLALQITLIPMEISVKGYVEMEAFSWKNAYEIENSEKEKIIVWQDNGIRCAASLQTHMTKPWLLGQCGMASFIFLPAVQRSE